MAVDRKRPLSNCCPLCGCGVTLRNNVEFFVCLGCGEMLYANELVPITELVN